MLTSHLSLFQRRDGTSTSSLLDHRRAHGTCWKSDKADDTLSTPPADDIPPPPKQPTKDLAGQCDVNIEFLAPVIFWIIEERMILYILEEC